MLLFAIFALLSYIHVPAVLAKIYEFGYYLSDEPAYLERLKNFSRVVIDAQNFTKEEIENLKKSGTMVYSYINAGSVEKDRVYYKRFKKILLGRYEGWPDEKWVDASKEEWRDFFVNELANELYNKGIDGFYIDNFDIYDEYPRKEILNGLIKILRGLRSRYQKAYIVVQNGLSVLSDYDFPKGEMKKLINGVSKEDVYSMPDFDAVDGGDNTYILISEEERKDIVENLKNLKSYGLDIYTVDYTNDVALKEKIEKYSKSHGFIPFIGNKNLDKLEFYNKEISRP